MHGFRGDEKYRDQYSKFGIDCPHLVNVCAFDFDFFPIILFLSFSLSLSIAIFLSLFSLNLLQFYSSSFNF